MAQVNIEEDIKRNLHAFREAMSAIRSKLSASDPRPILKMSRERFTTICREINEIVRSLRRATARLPHRKTFEMERWEKDFDKLLATWETIRKTAETAHFIEPPLLTTSVEHDKEAVLIHGETSAAHTDTEAEAQVLAQLVPVTATDVELAEERFKDLQELNKDTHLLSEIMKELNEKVAEQAEQIEQVEHTTEVVKDTTTQATVQIAKAYRHSTSRWGFTGAISSAGLFTVLGMAAGPLGAAAGFAIGASIGGLVGNSVARVQNIKIEKFIRENEKPASSPRNEKSKQNR
eukprot:GILJ01006290.1.p1 GENE.GILJ01006290.1~~GILJ01006290.1.p1  ORF type:complete len:306 (+),score=40.05 GILJ01006290.1:47-919(+)